MTPGFSHDPPCLRKLGLELVNVTFSSLGCGIFVVPDVGLGNNIMFPSVLELYILKAVLFARCSDWCDSPGSIVVEHFVSEIFIGSLHGSFYSKNAVHNDLHLVVTDKVRRIQLGTMVCPGPTGTQH